MERTRPKLRSAVQAVVGCVAPFLLVLLAAAPAAGQYGGVSGFFVTTSPATPGFADFSGLGCGGGQEVVLYIPGLTPTASDPAASQSVPGRIIAVGTTVSSADALLNGTFTFTNIPLPDDVEPGVYEVHARCGSLDMRVLIQIDSDGVISLDPDPDAPIINETPGGDGAGTGADGAGPGGALPITGRDPSRVVALATGLLAAGLMLMAASNRSRRSYA